MTMAQGGDEPHSSEPGVQRRLEQIAPFPQQRIHPDFHPGGRKALCSISLQAYGIGIALGVSVLLSSQLALGQYYLWRLPFFVAVLAVFHYLEFDMTARYNPSDAKVSSFLLFSNGRAYNIAHTMAMFEVICRHVVTSRKLWTRPAWTTALAYDGWPTYLVPSVALGLVLIIGGQTMRSIAMRQAGSSFNHVVQSTRRENHQLITRGVYKVSRHPAYAGFFWWAIGTQLILGNYISLLAYTVVLWKFFAQRIFHEEKHLVSFFGADYADYRKKTPVLIPFIR